MARAILRLDVPRDALPDGASIGRTGYWLLVLVSEQRPGPAVRAGRHGGARPVDHQPPDPRPGGRRTASPARPDPADGRAALLSLTEQGVAVLEAVSESRRQVLAEAIADWTDEERNALASGLLRLGAGLQHLRDSTADARRRTMRHRRGDR